MIVQLLPWVAGALVLALGWAVDRLSVERLVDVVVVGAPVSPTLGCATDAINERPATADHADDAADQADDAACNEKSLGHAASVLA